MMERRRLGRTGLEVGVIGLGTEYLVGADRQTTVAVIRRAMEAGVNYIDVLFAYEDYLDNCGAALECLRDRAYVTGHLGSGQKDGQYKQTRDLSECQRLFEEVLRRLRTEYVDVLFLSNCDRQEDYDLIMSGGGLYDMAVRLREQGKARFIGFSGHKVPVSVAAVAGGRIDVLMHNVNFASDAEPGRKELYRQAAAAGVGVVAMKPFGGGSLLEGGAKAKVTPVQCLNYAVSQPGVAAAVPGVKDVAQLDAALAWTTASAAERDYADAIGRFQTPEKGRCVYCNHCLPCPANIDIGRATRLLYSAAGGMTGPLAGEYALLPGKPSACTRCGACNVRCPFDVDAMANMARVAELFEPAG